MSPKEIDGAEVAKHNSREKVGLGLGSGETEFVWWTFRLEQAKPTFHQLLPKSVVQVSSSGLG